MFNFDGLGGFYTKVAFQLKMLFTANHAVPVTITSSGSFVWERHIHKWSVTCLFSGIGLIAVSSAAHLQTSALTAYYTAFFLHSNLAFCPRFTLSNENGSFDRVMCLSEPFLDDLIEYGDFMRFPVLMET